MLKLKPKKLCCVGRFFVSRKFCGRANLKDLFEHIPVKSEAIAPGQHHFYLNQFIL